jgi:hypothetical protein
MLVGTIFCALAIATAPVIVAPVRATTAAAARTAASSVRVVVN